MKYLNSFIALLLVVLITSCGTQIGCLLLEENKVYWYRNNKFYRLAISNIKNICLQLSVQQM